MSIATDMYTAAQTAYKDALSGKSKQINGRRLEQHDILALRKEMEYWEAKVAAETTKAAGGSPYKPMQVIF